MAQCTSGYGLGDSVPLAIDKGERVSISMILEVMVCCCLIFTGIVHLGNSYFFLSSILSYNLVAAYVAKQLAITLPILHLLLGLLVLGNVWKTFALAFASGLFAVYLGAQASALVRGIQIDCGCFGVDSHQIGLWSLVQVGALLAITIGLTIFSLFRTEERRK